MHIHPLVPCVFLDRDGTIARAKTGSEAGEFINLPEDLELVPRTGLALCALKQAGFKLALISNQGGVAAGHLTEDTHNEIHSRLEVLLEEGGIRLDAAHYCLEIDDVADRKPRPGMIYTAAWELDADLCCSYFVGDRWEDFEAGWRAGLTTVYVGSAKLEDQPLVPWQPKIGMPTLVHAAEWIIADFQKRFPDPKHTRLALRMHL